MNRLRECPALCGRTSGRAASGWRLVVSLGRLVASRRVRAGAVPWGDFGSSRDSLPWVTTWDYTTTVIRHGLLGRKEEELDREEFETAMNELGSEGWELATVFLDVALHREKDGHVLVFKRRQES
jgi:hypothetical protein